MAFDRKNLPRDIAGCHALIAQLAQELEAKENRLRRLLHQLASLLRWRFGPKRERVDERQLFLFAADLVARNEDLGVAGSDEPPGKAKKARGHGRQRLPEHLERRQVEYDLEADQRRCPECRQELKFIGEEVTERLEYVPASLHVIREVCYKYACPQGCTAITAPKPMQAIEKGLPGPGLLAHVAVSKYADHLPLHRQEQMFERQGVHLSRSTLCDWMRSSAELISPLYQKMKDEVLASKVMQTDDTPVGVLDASLTRTRTGRIWTYVGDKDHPYTVYDYTPNRSRDGPEAFMEEFSGYLQADAYSGYDKLYTDPGRDVTEVACWAHVRRKFYEAQSADMMRSMVILAYIQLLYEVEYDGRHANLDTSARKELRQTRSLPILTDIKAYLERERLNVLPKSPIGQAISYALSNWAALVRYCDDGDLEIDNNGAERSLRGVAVGRKNWLFFGSDNGGRTAAILTSFTATCKSLSIDPFAYLRDIFGRISAHPASRLGELLPDRWQSARAAAAT
jgi:transposase